MNIVLFAVQAIRTSCKI